jgi:hypothetical protein
LKKVLDRKADDVNLAVNEGDKPPVTIPTLNTATFPD